MSDRRDARRQAATDALAAYLATVIRLDVEDPDHGGPEDAAEIIAMHYVLEAEGVTSQWRGWLEDSDEKMKPVMERIARVWRRKHDN